MKRLIPAGLLAVILAALCITASAVTGRICRKNLQRVIKCEEAVIAGDIAAVTAAADELVSGWESDSRLLAVFSDNGFIDDIALLSARIQGSCNLSGNSVPAECAEIKKLLEDMEGEQIFCIESLY